MEGVGELKSGESLPLSKMKRLRSSSNEPPKERAKAARVLTNNDSGTGSISGGCSFLLQFAIEEFQLLLSNKWISFVEGLSCALAGLLQAEAASVLKDKGFKSAPVLEKFLDDDMLEPQSMVVLVLASSGPLLPATNEYKDMLSDLLSRIVEDVYSVLVDCLESKYLLHLQTKAAHDSGSHSNSGGLPGGSSLRQFTIKGFQKLLSDKWIPRLEDISCGLVRGLVKERKCCLQFQIETARVLTDKDFKHSPLLQKLLDGDMLDLRSIGAPVLPSNLQQPVTKEYEEVLSDKLSRIVEDVYSDFVRLVEKKYFLKFKAGAARTIKKSTPKFTYLPDPSPKIKPKLQEVDLFDLRSMVSLLESADSNIQLLGIKQLRKLFSEGFVSEDKGIRKSFVVVVVPLLANIMRTVDSLELQSEAAGTLVHLISHYSMKPLWMIKHKLVEVLVELLDTDSVCEKAVEELKKVAFYPQSRNYALQHRALNTLLRKLGTTNVRMLRKLTLTISKFCGGVIAPPFNQVRPAIIVLRDLLNTNADADADEEVLSNACKAFCYLSGTVDLSSGTTIWGKEKFEFNTVSQSEVNNAFHDAGVLPVLLKLLCKYSSHSILYPAIRTVANISTADDQKICIPMEERERFLDCLQSLLLRELEEKIVCVIIAGITGESTPWAEAVFAAGLIEPLRKLVDEKKMDVAAIAIANAIDGTADEKQIEVLVECCICLLCNYVDSDDKIWAGAGLEGIEKILKLGEANKAKYGGNNVYAQKIKEDGKLENFKSPRLALRAKKIMTTYWPSVQEPSR